MACCWENQAETLPVSPAQPMPQQPPIRPQTQFHPPPSEVSFSRKPLPPGCRRFTYRDLQNATGDFAANAMIGEGGFGNVYRGTLEDGRPVAIKRLNRLGLQGNKEFNVEVETLGQLRHQNLVNLVGACTEGHHRLAVFDLMPGRSLRDNLDSKHTELSGHWESPLGDLGWPIRLGIALDAARGLAYLHEGTRPGMIHRDVKSSNILIDEAKRARIADFGLALRTGHCSGPTAANFETGPTEDTEMLTGTYGYSAPEYNNSGRMTQKCDVYSFGVVLLELLTGQEPVNKNADRPVGSTMLVDEFAPFLEQWKLEELKEKVDPVLPAGSVPGAQLAYYFELVAQCLQTSASKRPKMSEVVRFLTRIMELREEVPTKKQENGRYTLASLMDRMDSVPPITSSLQMLPHTPMTHPQQHPADPFVNAENIQPNSNARAGPNSSNAAVQRRTAGDSIFSAKPAGIDHWPSMPLSRAASPFEYPPAASSCQASGRSTPVLFYSASSRELQGANDGLRSSHKVMSSFGATPLSAMPPPVYTGYSPLSEGQSVWQMPQATGGWVQFGVNGGVAKQQERSSAASN